MTKNQSFDFSVNVLRALFWQYNDAPSLQSLLESKQAWYDGNQRDFWNDWYANVFDLDTANDFGCAVWSIVLGIPLAIVVDRRNSDVFGFGSFNRNFSWGNFSQTQQVILNLTTAQKRLVLKLRYLQLISNGSVPQTNQFLKWAFGSLGTCWALDPLDMGEIVYVFNFAVPASVLFVLSFYDLLPRPAGVGVRVVYTNPPRWGFGPFRQNFGHGDLYP